jgi:hypothetical protein
MLVRCLAFIWTFNILRIVVFHDLNIHLRIALRLVSVMKSIRWASINVRKFTLAIGWDLSWCLIFG